MVVRLQRYGVASTSETRKPTGVLNGFPRILGRNCMSDGSTSSKAERYRRLRALFEEASALPEPDQPAYLRAHCVDDPELESEAHAMLRAARIDAGALRAGGGLEALVRARESPAVEGLASIQRDDAPLPVL